MINRQKYYFNIYISITIAILLTTIPLSDYFLIVEFDWIVLVVLFWLIIYPEKFSLISVWVCGIIIDVMSGNLLGQNAFSLLVVSFMSIIAHRQIKTMPLLQQSIIISFLVFVYRLINLWLNGIIGIQTPDMLVYFLNPLLLILIWPLAFSSLSMFVGKTYKF
ncbi:MAG: rod shape-determining protein MreD [Gammaproteobacteria bacterium]|nr:MAG: rod shape-determining protein MreD [Gammaproteobacteria bacterium]